MLFPKPARGTATRQHRARTASVAALERQAKADARKRDWHRCRWPDAHRCQFGLEVSHCGVAGHKGMGGDPRGLRSDRANLLTVCGWIHQHAGYHSIDGGGLRVEMLTADGTDGPVQCFRRAGDVWVEVGISAPPGTRSWTAGRQR